MAEGAQEVDILVVGSGLAGLTAALRFLDNARADASGHKPKVVILESDTVVGGRTRSTRLQDLPENSPLVSYGGTWVILDNQDLISLSQEVDWLPFQPKLLPNYSKGALNLGFFFAPYLLIKLWLIGKQIFQAPPDHPAYPELDATPLSVWVDQNKGSAFEPDKAAQAVIDWFFQVENYPSDIALLSTYFAAKSVFVRLSKITDTGLLVPKIMRWQDGTGAITHRMLEKIQSFGGSISFSRQVQSIAHDEHGATVSARVLGEETERVETFRAKYVVVATAVTNAANLTYTPELPEQSRGIIPSLQDWDDPSLQIIFAFKTQWWLSENQGASIYPAPIPDDQKGVYGPVFDLSETGPRTKGKKTKNGILRIICKTSRCTHADGTRWSDDEIQASAFQYLARFHQKRHETEEQTIARISKGLIQRWFFDFHQTPDINAVTFFIRPTEQSIYANNVRYLQDHYGRLYFAGSERATRGFNWMEGAVLSGRTTALQLLQAYYGESWTQANTDAYHAQLRQWLHEGLRRMKLEDVWDIPKYVATMWEIAWDSIAHFFDHLFHHEKPEMLHATLNGAKANFREPKNEAEAEILAELHAALENMPTESDMCLLDCQ